MLLFSENDVTLASVILSLYTHITERQADDILQQWPNFAVHALVSTELAHYRLDYYCYNCIVQLKCLLICLLHNIINTDFVILAKM